MIIDHRKHSTRQVREIRRQRATVPMATPRQQKPRIRYRAALWDCYTVKGYRFTTHHGTVLVNSERLS